MYPKDADKITFVTRQDIYLWRVMPFGLCNARATSQRLMDVVLPRINFEIFLDYLDDTIVFVHSWKQHLDRLESVFHG